MVVPVLSKATATPLTHTQTHTDITLGPGLSRSGSEVDGERLRAASVADDLPASHGSTPLRQLDLTVPSGGRADSPTLSSSSSPRHPSPLTEPRGCSETDTHEHSVAPASSSPPTGQSHAQAETLPAVLPHTQAKASRAERIARKTTMQVATLNMNGYGNLVRDHADNKWGRIYRMMAAHRLGVLLLQETHLTQERKASIHKMFANKVKIFHSEHPDAPTLREGVAVVLNSRFVNTAGASATEIIPGRALQLNIPCQGGDSRTILCVYAPTSNGPEERSLFFKELRQFYEHRPDFPRPQLMAGDFNNVKDSLDRLPIGSAPDASIVELDNLKRCLGLMLGDGWRTTHPSLRAFTFHRGTGRDAVFSRLDRIYVTQEVFRYAREWDICKAEVKTDHSLVSVQLTTAHAPMIGAGRPVFPLTLLKDKKLTKSIKLRGIEAVNQLAKLEVCSRRNGQDNPQTVLHAFKRDVMKIARAREREVIPRLLAEIREAEKSLRAVLANRSMSETEKQTEAASLTKCVRLLKQRRVKQQQQTSRATHRIYGDRPTKYWSKVHRECAPRDVISAFEIEGQFGNAGEKIYESDSTRMADMARTHHINVQRDQATPRSEAEREDDIVEALRGLDSHVANEQALALGGEFTHDECVNALRLTKNGSAPGLDGIPYELWKSLRARFVEDSRFPQRQCFDPMRLLKAAFEDIRVHGVCPTTAFAHGWMAPIYKEKGEKTRIVNYRPITILNTDYKLLSKMMATRLAEVAPQLIHRSQAGFVPGRRIQDHTQLARLMIDWAEMNEENGAIVALDQEKAYDKIAHDYLWRVLRRFRIPEPFIQIIQSLYAHAETSIMVNGIFSKAYRIFRGVRQGDPLSCLLFDLAIEPLSAMIRKSTIKGYNLPKCDEVLKAVLFADDTTVYLSHLDDFNTLQKLLDTWCSAAKARFNISKTEIIPIGEPEYRSEMAETYRLTGEWKNFPKGVHVAQEGEAVRILGAFLGNGIDQEAIWSLVLSKIVAMRQPLMQVISRWKKGHATLQGKKHVVQMIIGGITQYLTTVQRMPEIIRQRLNKVLRDYLWDDRHNSLVGLTHTFLPIELGGLGVLDLESRSKAIDIMWLKSYLDFSVNRPLWAFLADDIFATRVPKDVLPKQISLRSNCFLQRWKPRARGFSAELMGMVSVAKEFGLRLEGLAFSRNIIRSMPMWNHVYADRIRLSRLSVPSKTISCLQEKHKARSVGDFETLAVLCQSSAHAPSATCKCADCVSQKEVSQCVFPHLCCTRAREMIKTLPDKWNPSTVQPEDYEVEALRSLENEVLSKDLIPFDRRITTHGDLGQAFRIFTDANPVFNESIPMALTETGQTIVVATDGSCLNNGAMNAQAGAGVYYSANCTMNTSIRLPINIDQSNQTGEMAAALVAATLTGPASRMVIETDSLTTLDSLTKWKTRNEDTGYIRSKNPLLTKATIARLRMRKAHTMLRWVKGHNGHHGNEAADRLAALGAEKPLGDALPLDIPPAYSVSGAKLQSITQKLAYRAIRSIKDNGTIPRPRAEANMDRIICGIEFAYGEKAKPAKVWSSLRSKHVSRSASQFMWMALHDGYMLGSHWLRPNMSEELRARAVCGSCDELETMTHIVLECEAQGQETIWKLLKRIWSLTGQAWNPPSWGTTFGAACAVIKSSSGQRRPAKESLWTILCTEALHLIWKLRCERVIQNEGANFSETEITNRLYACLNTRLDLDRRTAAMACGKKSLKPVEVEKIWLPILEGKDNLPPNWVVNGGVLVGIRRGR